MPLSTTKADLLDLVQKAHALAPTKSSLQILSNLKLTATAGQLEVTATDLDHSICCTGQVSGSTTFDIAINARKLFDIVREIPDGEVTVEEDENVLSIVSEKGFSCKVAGTDVADFPSLPVIDSTVEFGIPVSDFRRLVSRSSFAVSRDTTRSCLCGVLWEVNNEGTAMIATDGHRLGRGLLSYTTGVAESLSVIVSPRTLQHVARIVETRDSDTLLNVAVGEKYLVLSGSGFRLCSKIIDGPYPDYDKVIPKNNPKSALVERTSLIDAVRRVSVLSNQKTHLIRLHFSTDSLEIRVLNRDIGAEARERIPIGYDGEEHTIGFNAVYFSEILGIAETPRVRLEMNTQISACLVKPWDDEAERVVDGDLFLIMPLRLREEP